MDETESRPHTTSLQNPTRGRKTTPSFSRRLGSTEIPWSGTWQGQQKLQPLALPRLPHGFYRFPERSIKAFGVLGYFPLLHFNRDGEQGFISSSQHHFTEHRPFGRKTLSSAKFCSEGRNKHFDNLFDIMEDIDFYNFFISHDSSKSPNVCQTQLRTGEEAKCPGVPQLGHGRFITAQEVL